MLWTIFLVLVVLWMLGVVSSYTLGGFIHVLLVLAVVSRFWCSRFQGERLSSGNRGAFAWPGGAAKENVVDSRSQASRVIAGAAIGAGFAYLFLTKRGHRLLDAAEPWLDDVIRDLQRLRGAAGKAREAVDEGRRSFAAVSDAIPFRQQKDWSGEPHH